MPPAEPTPAFLGAVLARGVINELRYPRLCASRRCRRHKRCQDIADRDPVCMAALHPVDRRRLYDLLLLALDIVLGRHPPHPSENPVLRDREDEAINILYDCLDDLPWCQELVFVWDERYSAPAEPPRPPAAAVDTPALLAEVKAALRTGQ